jgi:choline dehydrogenase-like flavoprotein
MRFGVFDQLGVSGMPLSAGLRVVDASLFPVVRYANTNFPALMTAEKIADAVFNS